MRPNEDELDFVVPYHIIDDRLGEDVDTEQHKARRGQKLRKRSIRHYRHATTKWGAALESFGPMWVSTNQDFFPCESHIDGTLVRHLYLLHRSWNHFERTLSLQSSLASGACERLLRCRPGHISRLLGPTDRALDHVPTRCRSPSLVRS